MKEKEYELSIDPHILELLGPNLYTNIYYVLAELIANAYDADAHNVYIIANEDAITVEDDGTGMSYENGDIKKYLNVAVVSRTTENDSLTKLKRKKMGRKGIGKLAALSVSENVLIKTICGGEKSGFILSRHINNDRKLDSIPDDQISFKKVTNNGTAIVMQKPQYKLHNSFKAIKKNLLKIFPLVNEDFKIHLMHDNKEEEVIEDFDKEMVSELATLITLGNEFEYLNEFFKPKFSDKKDELKENKAAVVIPIEMTNNRDEKREYNVEIKGWIGTYESTRGRKSEVTDFPDNFISLFANKKMGEFNILPAVGKNRLAEVYVVGQLHVDIFELTELPDIALSNRQGYKSDDPRYQAVLEHVREILLPQILKKRDVFVDLTNKEKDEQKWKKQQKNEESFRQKVDRFRENTTENIAQEISSKIEIPVEKVDFIKTVISNEINKNSPALGIKSKIDSQKKRILISHTFKDKDLADVVYDMLIFNNVPPEDILYTSCDDQISRIPEEYGVYDYLRNFFVDSYSTEKIYVIFVTSENTRTSWGALVEVGAAWITKVEHKIFNIYDFRPEHPLDDQQQWHTSYRNENDELYMNNLGIDKFSEKIEYICTKLGYNSRQRNENRDYLVKLVKVDNKI